LAIDKVTDTEEHLRTHFGIGASIDEESATDVKMIGYIKGNSGNDTGRVHKSIVLSPIGYRCLAELFVSLTVDKKNLFVRELVLNEFGDLFAEAERVSWDADSFTLFESVDDDFEKILLEIQKGSFDLFE
jgi:hypothetical protein